MESWGLLVCVESVVRIENKENIQRNRVIIYSTTIPIIKTEVIHRIQSPTTAQRRNIRLMKGGRGPTKLTKKPTNRQENPHLLDLKETNSQNQCSKFAIKKCCKTVAIRGWDLTRSDVYLVSILAYKIPEKGQRRRDNTEPKSNATETVATLS